MISKVLDLKEITEFYKEYCKSKNQELEAKKGKNSNQKAIESELAKKKKMKSDILVGEDSASTKSRTITLGEQLKKTREMDIDFNMQRRAVIKVGVND